MADVEILQPVLNGGIKNASFTDGQLLTAEHLRTEQTANRAQHQQLGRGIGEGVADGFVVEVVSRSATKPVLRVTQGLAFNRNGEAVALGETSNVTLVKDAEAAQATAEAGLFAKCSPGKQAVNTGLYLLTVEPASGYQGRIEMTELVSAVNDVTCARKFAVEGVQFRLLGLDLGSSPAVRPQMAALASPSGAPSPAVWVLRSGLAHILFGTDRLGSRFGTNPFEISSDGSPFAAYGLIDELREAKLLSPCEVPLSVLYWSALGLQFVDMWAARRRLTPPLLGDPWTLVADPRRVYEGEAMLLQFQAQLEEIRENENPQVVTAKGYFRFLPAAGFVPIRGPRPFGENLFWTGLDVERVPLDRAFVRYIIHQSYFVDAIDLASPPPLKLYQVEDQPEYLLFFREDVIPQAAPAPQPSPPADQPEPPKKDPGNIFVEIRISDPKVIDQIGKVDPGDIEVRAVDKRGKSYPGKPYKPKSKGVTIIREEGRERGDTLEADYLISKLPPADYKVEVRVLKLKPASRNATVQSGKTVTVTFELKPQKVRPSKDGRAVVKVKHPWYEKMRLFDKYAKWPWPPPEVGPRPFERVDPAPETIEQIEDFAEELAGKNPSAPVDPGDIAIYVAKDHTPAEVATAPYAYAVFGNGAYVPAVLIPTGKDFGVPVAVTRAEVGGLEEAAHGQDLRESGIDSLDVFAHGWTGLVEDALGVGADTAKAMIGEARKQASAIQNSPRMFSGVDKSLADELKEKAQISDAKDLANADPDALVQKLGEARISPAFARRLIEDARKSAPRSEWSLDSPELGLTEDQKSALEKSGIRTRADLEKASAAALAEALKVGQPEASSLIDRSKATRAEAAKSLAGREPVTDVAGVNRESGVELARLGVHRTAELAKMQPEAIARAFGNNIEAAKAAVNAAKARLTR